MNDESLRQHLLDLIKMQGAHISFEDAIKDLKPENRTRKVQRNLYSIWDNLEHMRIAQNDLLNYMLDENWESPKWPEEYWSPEDNDDITDEKWNESVTSFHNDLENIIELITSPKTDLFGIIPGTKNHTYLREILIAADHNSYHTGQIVLMRRLLGDWET
jgi:uncharacterized damage-inducible protein DinB